jgi:hypothetical protein
MPNVAKNFCDRPINMAPSKENKCEHTHEIINRPKIANFIMTIILAWG